MPLDVGGTSCGVPQACSPQPERSLPLICSSTALSRCGWSWWPSGRPCGNGAAGPKPAPGRICSPDNKRRPSWRIRWGGHGSPALRTPTRPMPSGGRTCRRGRSDSWRWTCTRSLNLLQPLRGDALPHLVGAHRPHAESGEQLYVFHLPRAAAPFQLITIGIADADARTPPHPEAQGGAEMAAVLAAC